MKTRTIECDVAVLGAGIAGCATAQAAAEAGARVVVAERSSGITAHGLDVGAVNSIHEVLLEEKKKGTAILLISEDLEELFQMSDRIAVMYDSRIMDVLDADQASLDTIGSLMTGQERREEGSYAAI